jgi:MOSC domain-containing protein YiiM
MFRLAERHPAGVTVACANKLKYHDKRNTEGIRQLLDVAELSDSWRTSFLQRLRTLEE